MAVTLGALLLMLASVASAQTSAGADAGTVLEIRSYNLKPGTRDSFHERFLRDVLPMLQRWEVDVVAYGPSLHDENSYFLMRAFAGLEHRQQSEDAFYGSGDWRNGPRAEVLAAIDSYTTVVICVDDATLGGVRRIMSSPPDASQLEVLLRLNEDYIRSVRTADVRRFGEILAQDFLCTLGDGRLVERAQFLEHTAKAGPLRDLEAHDVEVRFMGDIAIVHGRTTFTLADGRPGAGRYTDVWARRDGRWLAVSAHVTRQ